MSERLIRSAVRRALYDVHMVLPDGTGAADLLSEILQRLDVELSSRASEATAEAIASRLDVNLSSLRDSLKPSRGTASQDLSLATVNASSYIDVDKSGLDGWSALYVVAQLTYNASATAGARIVWMYSPDGTVYEDEGWAVQQGNYVDPPFSAGATVTVGFLVPLLTDYVKIRVRNNDSTYALTVNLWSVPLR